MNCHCALKVIVLSPFIAIAFTLPQTYNAKAIASSLKTSQHLSRQKQRFHPITTQCKHNRQSSALSVIPDPTILDFHHIIESCNLHLPSLTLASDISSAEIFESAIEEKAVNSLGRDIFTFLAASVVVVPLSRALNVTPVLGFLAVGCAIGPFGFQIFANSEADLQLGDFGILFLLFNEGLSLSPNRIKALSAFSGLGLLQIVFSFLVFFIGTIFGGPILLQVVGNLIPIDDGLLRPILSSPVQAFCIASAGALSSSAFVLPVLKQKEWEDRPEGIAGLSILLLQDLAVAPLLVILPLLAGSGPQTSSDLGILVFKATVGFGAVLVAGSYLLRGVFEFVAAAKSTETFVAAALLVVISMGQAADFLGLSASTGAFAAGVLLAGNKYRPQIQADIKPFEGIFLGIFFLTAGGNLDPVLVLREWPTLLTGIAVFLVTKTTVLFLEGPALGLTASEAARVAFTLSGGGEFSFVLFKIAQDLGVLPDSLTKVLTASVIVSMSLTPILGEVGDFVGNYIESRDGEKGFIRDQLSTAEAKEMFDEIDEDRSGSICITELRTALLKLNFQYASIAEVFAAFDTNNDNVISREEWKTGVDAGLLDDALNTIRRPRGGAMVPQASADSISENSIAICGFGKMGRATYRMLQTSGATNVVAFSLDKSRVTAGVLSGASVIYGDGARIDIFKAAGIQSPKAVVITYASEPRRLDATYRLRETLPQGTPIYVRAGDKLFCNELLNAGATEVISETTEAVLRFGSLLGTVKTPNEATFLRESMLAESNGRLEAVPGYSEEALVELAETYDIKRSGVSKLYDLYASYIDISGDNAPIGDLRDFIMRNSESPIDAKDLDKYLKAAIDDEGRLPFDKFVRISTRSISASR
jgi:Kef-type K+ transport system membrane component KefB/voltage-gated potassium channel Kch